MKISIITTGGSIDKLYSYQTSNFEVGEPQVRKILQEANVNFAYTIKPLFKKDSLHITDQDRKKIRHYIQRTPGKYFMIIHGTDTMVKTAKMLCDIPNKVIVLTGAMRPAVFKDSDAAFNIGTAMGGLQTLSAGVYLAMNGEIFHHDRARKNIKLFRFERI